MKRILLLCTALLGGLFFVSDINAKTTTFNQGKDNQVRFTTPEDGTYEPGLTSNIFVIWDYNANLEAPPKITLSIEDSSTGLSTQKARFANGRQTYDVPSYQSYGSTYVELLKEGKFKIKATVGTESKELCSIEVKSNNTYAIEGPVSLIQGESKYYKLTTTDNNMFATSVKWSVDDSNILQVIPDGEAYQGVRIKALKEGRTILHAKFKTEPYETSKDIIYYVNVVKNPFGDFYLDGPDIIHTNITKTETYRLEGVLNGLLVDWVVEGDASVISSSNTEITIGNFKSLGTAVLKVYVKGTTNLIFSKEIALTLSDIKIEGPDVIYLEPDCRVTINDARPMKTYTVYFDLKANFKVLGIPEGMSIEWEAYEDYIGYDDVENLYSKERKLNYSLRIDDLKYVIGENPIKVYTKNKEGKRILLASKTIKCIYPSVVSPVGYDTTYENILVDNGQPYLWSNMSSYEDIFKIEGEFPDIYGSYSRIIQGYGAISVTYKNLTPEIGSIKEVTYHTESSLTDTRSVRLIWELNNMGVAESVVRISQSNIPFTIVDTIRVNIMGFDPDKAEILEVNDRFDFYEKDKYLLRAAGYSALPENLGIMISTIGDPLEDPYAQSSIEDLKFDDEDDNSMEYMEFPFGRQSILLWEIKKEDGSISGSMPQIIAYYHGIDCRKRMNGGDFYWVEGGLYTGSNMLVDGENADEGWYELKCSLYTFIYKLGGKSMLIKDSVFDQYEAYYNVYIDGNGRVSSYRLSTTKMPMITPMSTTQSTYSIKIYSLYSTKVLHQEDNVEYFDIYNTSLSPGMYVLEKTDSEGNVTKEKVYKGNY